MCKYTILINYKQVEMFIQVKNYYIKYSYLNRCNYTILNIINGMEKNKY